MKISSFNQEPCLCACVGNNGGILAKKKVKSEQNDLEALSKIAKLELLMFIQMACRPNKQPPQLVIEKKNEEKS